MDDPNNTIQPPQLLDLSMTHEQATAKLAEMAAAQVTPAPPPLEPKTPGDAQRRLDLLTKDREWGARYLSGDLTARTEFRALQDQIAGRDLVSETLAGTLPAGNESDFSSEDRPSRYVLNETVRMYRDSGISDGAISQALKGTPETPEAIAAVRVFYNQKTSDPEWRAKLLSGDATAKREWMLMSIVLSGAPA